MAVRRRSIVELEATLEATVEKAEADLQLMERRHEAERALIERTQMGEQQRLQGRLDMAREALDLAQLEDESSQLKAVGDE